MPKNYAEMPIDSQAQFQLPEALAEDFEKWWRAHDNPRFRSKAEALRHLMAEAINSAALANG